MSGNVTISLSAERLDSGTAEEQATFGLFAITANDRLLTEGAETGRNDNARLRRGPYVAGYPLAEWLAWNRWRIRWEYGRPARTNAAGEWDFAHRMATVGDGYAWPDITIYSDGLQSFLLSAPTRDATAMPFRYFGASPQRMPAARVEEAIDGFLADMAGRLDERELRRTNLHRLLTDLKVERADPALARFRRLEAQLGSDPDELDEGVVRRRLDDAPALGEEALGEIAADAAAAGAPHDMTSARQLTETAEESGFDSDPRDAVALADAGDLPRPGEAEAWRVGKRMAQDLRDRERLDGQPLSNERLAEFAGTTADAIALRDRRSEGLSFALERGGSPTRLALRSKWAAGRRFDLARLIGDRLLGALSGRPAEPLSPATRAYSYRQKAQRAFAAELLSPIAAVKSTIGGDTSDERQRDAADYFAVSEFVIRTQLVNHGLVAREDAPELADRGPLA